MAFGDRVEVGAGEHERVESLLGILWIRVCRGLEYFVEDLNWAALDRHEVRGEGFAVKKATTNANYLKLGFFVKNIENKCYHDK